MSNRPKLHFTPPHGWINDPNGLVYDDGCWHLFYQYFPDGLKHGPMHWGHAVSRDLVIWEHWGIALAPDELGNIWSGSAIVTEEGILTCFTHQSEQRQAQSYALSSDGGRSFTKDAANPILSSQNPDFRDPKLFRGGEQWYIILATGPTAQIFVSSDLRNWKLQSEVPAPQPDWLWECPDLFDLDGVWVLIGSFIIPGRPHETYYWLGDFDGQSYTPQSGPNRLSFGPDDYAAVSWSNAPDGRRLIIGWMSRWEYAASTPTATEGYRGAMTLPRELTLEDGHLCQNPPRELTAYRGISQSLSGWEAGEKLALASTSFEIEANLEVGDAPECGFAVITGENEVTTVGYDARSGELFIDRTRSGQVDFAPTFAGRFQAPHPLQNNSLSLRIIVDTTSIELFADNGQCYGAALIYPTSQQRHIEFFGAGARMVNGQVFEVTN